MELLSIAAIVVSIVALSRVSGLKKQIAALRQKLTEQPQNLSSSVAPPPQNGLQNQNEYPPKNYDSGPSSFDRFIIWLKTDWLMKIGAFFLILALAWFVSLSFVNNWIGPMGRIALGIVTGSSLLIWGHILISKKTVPGQVIVATGATMILLTIFAAREIYDFFTPASALGIMGLVVALTAVIAVKHRTLALAFLASLGGAVAPLLTAAPSPDFVALLTYIFVLDLGILAIVMLRGWRSLILLGLLTTAAYSMSFNSIAISTVWIFMAAFFALFFAFSVSAIWKNKNAILSDIIAVALIIILGFYWVVEFIPEHLQSSVLAGTALLIAILSALLFQKGAPRVTVYLHSAAAVALLGAATALELEGSALIITFFVEALALLAVARFGLRDSRAILGAVFLQILPISLSFESFSRWSNLGSEFAVLVVGTVSLAASAFLLRGFPFEKRNDLIKILSTWAALSLVMIIWRTLEVLLESTNYAHGTALVVYALVGIVLFFHGTFQEIKVERIAGMLLLVGVVARLLLVEIWTMNLEGKVVTFLLVGALLISTAFFGKTKKIENA